MRLPPNELRAFDRWIRADGALLLGSKQYQRPAGSKPDRLALNALLSCRQVRAGLYFIIIGFGDGRCVPMASGVVCELPLSLLLPGTGNA